MKITGILKFIQIWNNKRDVDMIAEVCFGQVVN